jgi:hypothetical protein
VASYLTDEIFLGGLLLCFVSVAFGYGEEANSPAGKAVWTAWGGYKKAHDRRRASRRIAGGAESLPPAIPHKRRLCGEGISLIAGKE